MAQAITNLNPVQDDGMVGVPKQTQADLSVIAANTTNSNVFTLPPNMRSFRAYAYLKTTAGALTIEVKLQVAGTSAFNDASVITVDQKLILVDVPTSGTFGGYYLQLFGAHPLIAGAGFARLSFVTGTGTSATVDIMIDAA